ncbi:MAG: aromatic ring-hydroxylating dioxygenase subunit alpha [Caulobacteraceae bacterium]|nr:aromatic ring-hydroxylating dioxygenase subunit alpha [Caulobacteraceae bacterium]
MPSDAETKAREVGAAKAPPPYPAHLKVEKPPYRPGVMRVPVDRYFRQEYHDLEVERIWKKCWQWVCREDEIPEVGDYIVYDVAELSFIVVRTAPGEIKAYWNSCPHRARRLCDFDGTRAREFRCMFHGWAWGIDGAMTDMTCGWDFPGTRDEVSRLPEAKTGTWGGFVFINPDPACESLAEFLGELPDHFEKAGLDLSKRWTQVHVVADVPCNWKVLQEAFLEAWHVHTTHPQLVYPPTDRAVAGMRWDDFGNWIRSAPALPTDEHKAPPGYSAAAETEQAAVNPRYDWDLNLDPPLKVQPGEKAIDVLRARSREVLRGVIGEAADDIPDVHLAAGEMCLVWPNLHPWGGLSRLCYRFRPYKSDPNRALMDVLYLSPWPEGVQKPPPAPAHVLGPDETIGDAPELGQLARIFQQDLANVPKVQSGLKTSQLGYVILSDHNEAPVRHFHDLYDRWMGFENGDYLAERSGL